MSGAKCSSIGDKIIGWLDNDAFQALGYLTGDKTFQKYILVNGNVSGAQLEEQATANDLCADPTLAKNETKTEKECLDISQATLAEEVVVKFFAVRFAPPIFMANSIFNIYTDGGDENTVCFEGHTTKYGESNQTYTNSSGITTPIVAGDEVEQNSITNKTKKMNVEALNGRSGFELGGLLDVFKFGSEKRGNKLSDADKKRIETLGSEVEQLEQVLAAEGLTDAPKAVIKASLDAKTAELEAMKPKLIADAFAWYMDAALAAVKDQNALLNTSMYVPRDLLGAALLIRGLAPLSSGLTEQVKGKDGNVEKIDVPMPEHAIILSAMTYAMDRGNTDFSAMIPMFMMYNKIASAIESSMKFQEFAKNPEYAKNPQFAKFIAESNKELAAAKDMIGQLEAMAKKLYEEKSTLTPRQTALLEDFLKLIANANGMLGAAKTETVKTPPVNCKKVCDKDAEYLKAFKPAQVTKMEKKCKCDGDDDGDTTPPEDKKVAADCDKYCITDTAAMGTLIAETPGNAKAVRAKRKECGCK